MRLGIVSFVTAFAYACSTSMWANIALSGGIITPTWTFGPILLLLCICLGTAIGGASGWLETSDDRSSLSEKFTKTSLACAALLLLLPLYNAFLTGGFGFPVVTTLVNGMLSAGFAVPLISLCMVGFGAAVGLGLTMLGAGICYGLAHAVDYRPDSVQRVATLHPRAIDANGLGLCQHKFPEIVSLTQDTETQDIERPVVSVDDFAELPSYGQ